LVLHSCGSFTVRKTVLLRTNLSNWRHLLILVIT
jgi:hypothetical protein